MTCSSADDTGIATQQCLTAAADWLAGRPFGWTWPRRSLRLRKPQPPRGVCAHRCGIRRRCTQKAFDLSAAGHAGTTLPWFGVAAVTAIGMEAALTSVPRRRVEIRLTWFLNRRISRRTFLHLMRQRIDIGATPAGDAATASFQQAGKVLTQVIFRL